jgi:hypothetical protein
MKRSFFAIAVLASLAGTAAAQAQVIRTNPGFLTASVPRNDDGSSPLAPLGFAINLFGKGRAAVFVNNNGNITFDGPLSTFTPFGLRSTAREIIAPFFADVDTRAAASKLVTYGRDTVNGHRAFGANYVDVGYYASHTDKLNSFQLVLIERADQGPGDFDIEFNYGRILWETGDASGGVNGFGGTPAAAGWSNGGDTSYELPGSLIPGAFLDNGPYALVRQSITGAVVNTTSSQSNGRAGRLIFRARDGVISPGLVISGGQFSDATLGSPYSENLTVAGADPPFRWTFQPDVIAPPGLSLNANGVLTGTPTAAGTYSFTVGVTGNSEDGEITVFERGSITVRPAALRIVSSCPLPDALAGNPYSQTLVSAGATGAVWSVRDPLTLPQGLGLSSSGLLAGTPQTPGTYYLNLEVKSADGTAVPAQSICKLNVNPAAIRLTGCSLPHATVGVPFSQLLQPTGGFTPYLFELIGDLPQGTALTREGLIAGTPGTWGVWIFKIATTDNRGTRNVQDCSMIVDPARFTTSVCPLPSGVTGVPYNANLGTGFVWSVIGKLPGGLLLSPDGKITGTPMVAGGALFQLLATNGQGEQSAESCSLIVQRGPLSVEGCPLPDARAGDFYSAVAGGVGGASPYLFSTVAGNLPEGISLSPAGQFSGTANIAGSYAFTLRLRDGTQASALQACQLKVIPAELRLTTPCPLPDGRAGESYSISLEAAGGTAPYQFAYGLLPNGLTGAPNGTITGRSSELGGRSFNVRITDAANQTAGSVCSLAVVPPVVPAISLVDPPATVASANTSLSLAVQMAAAYTAPVKGQISMSVVPNTRGTDPVANSVDPLLAFANGQRTTTFTIPAGATRTTIPVTSTGTVASTVSVSLAALEASGAPLAQYPAAKLFRLAPAAPVITSACFVRTNSEAGIHLDFRVTGVSNTRELTRAQVIVPGLTAAKSNLPVPAEFVFDGSDTLTVVIGDLAEAYYAAPLNVRTGGAFTLTIPVGLDKGEAALAPTTKLDSIQFNLFNEVGAAGQRAVTACQ